MRVGFVLGNSPVMSKPEAIVQIARQAERLGFDSLWVTEQERFPVVAGGCRATVYDGSLPKARTPIECPIEALALAASETARIALGISIPNVPFYSPVLVAKSVAMIDALSNGRAQIGLGLGSTPEEFAYVASALSRSDTPASEFVQAVRAILRGSKVDFHGDYFYIPRASAEDCRECPDLPIRLTAFTPAAVQQPAALLGSGTGLSIPKASQLRERAAEMARSADGQPVVARAMARISYGPLGSGRAAFSGSPNQIRTDIAVVAEMGADEVIFDLSLDPAVQGIDDILIRMRQIASLVAGPIREHMTVA